MGFVMKWVGAEGLLYTSSDPIIMPAVDTSIMMPVDHETEHVVPGFLGFVYHYPHEISSMY